MRRPPIFCTLLLLAWSAHGQAPPAAKIIERYKQMLAANPTEGTALDRLWKLYAEQGQTGQLIEEYRGDASPAAQLIHAHLLRRAGRHEEAAAAFQKAAARDPRNPQPALALARLKSERGHPREAAVAYEQSLALLEPNDPQQRATLLALGTAWLEAGEMERAAAAWEKTVQLDPRDLALRRQLAELYERHFLPERALAHLAHLEAHAPPTERPLALQQIARLHQGAGRQDAAMAALDAALALTGPGNYLRAELESQLIRLHQRYHREAELETRWKKFAEENPRDLGACLQLVALYERLGEPEQQRAWLTKLTELAPKNVEYRFKLARLLMHMEAPEMAVDFYDKLLVEQPANADFVFERARIDVQMDDPAKARERLTALLVARKNDETLRARALAFYEQHRLHAMAEEHLVADAAEGGEDALAALANFYFAQRREADARQALARLVRPGDPPARQAAAQMRIAQLLRAQNDLDAAVAALRSAAELQPGSREAQLALGDLLAARGDYPGAQFAFEKAARLSTNDGERLEADQKLFESFRAQSPAATARRDRPWMAFAPPGETAAGESSAALEKFVAGLQRDAVDQISVSSWLRLARWRLWNRDFKSALVAAQKALLLDPRSIPAHELLVKIEVALGQTSAATASLLALAGIDPAQRVTYERRAAQYELEAGRVVEALAIFDRLAAENPGNLDALTDLALTQQRAERWTDAVATWRQVHALSPASRRKETLPPLLRALERLQLYEESATLQLAALEAEPATRERLKIFNDLLTFGSQHGQLPWLRTQLEKRRRMRADDYFTEVAFGRLLKASGETAAAFEVLADASYAAPNQAEALPELIREAEELHKLDAAVKLQAQLLRIAPQDDARGLEKLAQLQEKNFAIDDAARTWERAVAKAPRDAATVQRAVEFHLSWGTPERALALLRKARDLEPANLRTLAQLATLALEAGATAEAESCLEQILRHTPAEKPGDPLRFPALKPTEAGRLQTAYLTTVGQRQGRPTPDAMRALRSFWVEETTESKGERETRLQAIRQLAVIMRGKDAAAREAWIQRWRADRTVPSESLWALFHAGDGGATLDRAEALIRERAGDPKIAQAFIWLALQTQQYERLGAWLRDKKRTPSERDFFFIALGQSLDAAGGPGDPGMVKALFGDDSHLRAWQAATLFASRRRYREAIALGRRIFDRANTQRAEYGLELAHWHLFLGEPDAARAILRDSIAAGAESLEAPVWRALREYWLLLPPGERAQFSGEYLAGLEAARQPLHTLFATVLLRGLAGEEAAAHAALERLLALRPLAGAELREAGHAGARHLRFLLETGAELQALKMEALAIYFWEKALSDPALLALQNEPGGLLAHEMRQRLYALRAALAEPGAFSPWVEAYARSSLEGVAPLAGALAAMGAHARAIALFRQIWERVPEDAEALRNLLNACRAAGDHETAEAALRSSQRERAIGLADGAQREFILQLIDLLEQRGDFTSARVTLEKALADSGGDTRLLLRLGQMETRAENFEAAAKAYESLLALEPGNAGARLALSAVYEKLGRLPEALTQALAQQKGSAGPDFSANLAGLLLKNGRAEEAMAVIDRLNPPQHIAPALSLAAAFSAQGDARRAREVMHAALSRTEARLSFPLQCKLLETLAPEDGGNAARRELRRLRKFAAAGENPAALLDSYFEVAGPQAARLGVKVDFQRVARALWMEGAGVVSAGVALLALHLEAGETAAAAGVAGALAKREDAGEAALQAAAEALEKAGAWDGLARVQEAQARQNPASGQALLHLARTLHKLGRTDEARARLEWVTLRGGFQEDSLGQVAQAFAEIGDRDRALALHAQAARGDRFARNWAALLPFARLQTQAGDFAGAKATLRTAFTHPANRQFVEIIEWLVAAGRLPQAESEIAGFHLTPERLAEWQRVFADYAKKAGLHLSR